MADRRRVFVTEDEIPTVSDIMALIVKLPYQDAISFAVAVEGDVDKVTEGAANWLEMYPEAEEETD